MSLPRALLIGYGNPGRGDDGLGPAFAQRIADKKLPGLSVEIDFQLMADHSLTISQHDLESLSMPLLHAMIHSFSPS